MSANIIIAKHAGDVARRAADRIVEAIWAKPAAALALPTGNTPIPMYGEMAARVARGDADFSRATIWAIDEFIGPTRETPGTNSAFYREHVRFGQHALHCPNPSAQDPQEHIRAFADAVRRAGGIDLCVLGIGENGHIAFNEPRSARDSRARVVDLTIESRRAHAGAFGSLGAVPARGITLGIADLLESRSIIVLATGASKAKVVAAAIEGSQTADVPASWLQSVAVTWLLDEAAAAALSRRSQ